MRRLFERRQVNRRENWFFLFLSFSSFLSRGDCCCLLFWKRQQVCSQMCVLALVGRRNALGDDALINMFQQQFLPCETGRDAEKKVSPSPESKLVITIIIIIIIIIIFFFFFFKSSSSRAEGRRRRQRGVTMRRWRRLITSNRVSAAGLLCSFSFW